MHTPRSLSECVSLLEELALLLELSDANPFRIRAIQNGARVLDTLHGELTTLLADGTLHSTKGIGKGLLELIEEYHRTGSLAEVRELRTIIPPGVVSLTSVRGVGGKKAKALYDQLGIASIGELEYACKENRLIELKGFGPKTQSAILSAIESLNAYQGKCRLPVAREIADQVCNELLQCGAEEAQVTGQIARHCEIIDEIVVVFHGCSIDTVADHLEAECHGNSAVFERDGVAIRAVHSSQNSFARSVFMESAGSGFLHAFEQSFTIDDFANEVDVFTRNNLDYIPYECREDAEVLLQAKEHSLPQLVAMPDMRGMLHIHTTWSDGSDSIREMALRSKELGFTYIAVCDHSKTAVYAQGLGVERVIAQHKEIDALNNEGLGIRILKGIESDILPDGSLDYDEEILAKFDVVVASVHSSFRLDKAKQTERIVRAMRNPYTTILGHPTGRLLLARDGYDVDMARIIDVAAETGTVIELNANPYRLDIDWRLHQSAVRKGVRIAINPDSHQKETLWDVHYGIGIARKGMLRPSDVVNTLELDDFLCFVQKLRAQKLAAAESGYLD